VGEAPRLCEAAADRDGTAEAHEGLSWTALALGRSEDAVELADRYLRRFPEAGKKTKGVKRHVLVDTLGLMLRAVVHPASVQDRDGLAMLLDRRTRRRFPDIDVVFADQGYQGPKAATATARSGTWRLEIVRREPGQKGFAVLPTR